MSDKVEYDYSKLRGLIKEHYNTLKNFSEALGISQTSLNDRLHNRIVFGQDEIERSIALLHIDADDIPRVFFNRK